MKCAPGRLQPRCDDRIGHPEATRSLTVAAQTTMPAMPRKTPVTALLAAALLSGVAGGGCVQRTISIQSEPQGALVYLNDEEVGRTPLTVPFTFYGVYDVRLEKEGYQPLWTQKEADAPWWEAPGPDLFAEMVPDNEVNLEWHFSLEPQGEVDPAVLLDHAQQLRARVRQDDEPEEE